MPGVESKVAIVTGGGSGMGFATAELLAASGAHVVVADWNLPAAEAAAERVAGALALHVDITQDAAVERMVAATIERHGRLDILVNNAGGERIELGADGAERVSRARVVDMPREDWDAIVAINLTGAALCCKHALPHMQRQGAGAVVNNASINALVGLLGSSDAYTAAKGGLLALTRALAAHWGPRGIRVNCVCPGAIETPMVADRLASAEDRARTQAEIPLRRIAHPAEVAAAIVFLASEAASYIHGVVLPIDGGFAASGV